MRYRLLVALLSIGLIASIAISPATAHAQAVTPSEITTISDLEGTDVGVVTGVVLDEIIVNELHAAPAYYSEISSGLEDVRLGRLAGFITDLSAARVIASNNADLEVIALPPEVFSLPIGAFSMDQARIDSFNQFIASITSDGTLRQIQDRWLAPDADLDTAMPDFPAGSGENGRLTVATTGTGVPFTFTGAGGELKGFSIELISRYAAWAGLDIDFKSMDFSGLIPYVVSGKADIGIEGVSITPERQEQVLFSVPIYDDQAGVLVPADGTQTTHAATSTPAGVENIPLVSTDSAAGGDNAAASGGLGHWVQSGIQRNLIQDGRWKMVVSGLGVTLLIALAAQVRGTALGCALCYVLLRKNRLAQMLGKAYCSLIQGTPVVVLLMITYYIVFGSSTASNVLIAIVAFTLVTAVAVAGTLKSAIGTVDPTEIEAARSLGFTPLRTFALVTLPQAVQQALPAYLSGFVELVKATAIVGYIAIMDLTRAGDIIRSRTYDAYFPLLLVALIYLLVTTLLVFIFKRIVRRINVGVFA